MAIVILSGHLHLGLLVGIEFVAWVGVAPWACFARLMLLLLLLYICLGPYLGAVLPRIVQGFTHCNLFEFVTILLLGALFPLILIESASSRGKRSDELASTVIVLS
jgi:hypothetical protein